MYYPIILTILKWTLLYDKIMITIIWMTSIVTSCHNYTILYVQPVRKEFYLLYAEVGIEAEGITEKFQSLSAAHWKDLQM